jgi:hypothetical protein
MAGAKRKNQTPIKNPADAPLMVQIDACIAQMAVLFGRHVLRRVEQA